MSRSGYNDDCEGSELAMYRGQVSSATRGKRGQKLLCDMLAAMDAMPDKKLYAGELVKDGDACALGVVGLARGMDVATLAKLDPEDAEHVGEVFDIATCLAREVVYWNDDGFSPVRVTGAHGREYYRVIEGPDERWTRMRKWVQAQIKETRDGGV